MAFWLFPFRWAAEVEDMLQGGTFSHSLYMLVCDERWYRVVFEVGEHGCLVLALLPLSLPARAAFTL